MTAPLLLIVLLITAILVAVTVVSLLAWAILHPPRMTDGKAAWVLKRVSPGDLGMRYEEVQFQVLDRGAGEPLKIHGWWIPSTAAGCDRCVVMIHGYADAKVGSIAWAPTWQSLGFHILAIDLRAHGESAGAQCTGGYFERDDVRQVIHQLRARFPQETAGGVALFGVSLGSLIAAAVAGDGGTSDVERPVVAAVVLESPIMSFRDAVTQHIQMLGVAGPWATAASLRLAEWVSGADFNSLRLTELLKTIDAPVLLIGGEHDPFSSPEMQAELEAAIDAHHNAQDAIYRVLGAGHLMSLVADPIGYRATVDRFLAQPMGNPVRLS